jgi:hypothetical protein
MIQRKKKTKKNINKKKYTKRFKKYGGTPKIERLNASRKNVSSILERIKKTQDASRANMQKMFRYIKGESLPQYDIGQAKSGSPVYDLGQAEHPDPVYDIGQAEHPDPVYDIGQAKSGSPIYDIGQAKSGSPIYDLGQAKSGSPIYDLGQADVEPNLKEALLKIPTIIDISTYNSDTGTRDLSTEKSYNKDTPFIEILKIANKLKAPLIVKTSYINDDKPGAWYIKGYNNKLTYDEIKSKIEENVENRKYNKRICYLIKYDLGQAKSGSPIYDLGQAEPLYDLGQADADPTGQTSMDKLDITSGSWFYYILKIVDSQPRTEKELCELMKLKFPVRVTGKTPCNTLNTMLQTLVKHGYINRIAFKTKGTQKRQNYKYFKKDIPSKTDYIEIMPNSIDQETPIQDEPRSAIDESQPSETFKLIVKKVLDKNKIYNRDDLIKFCNGSDRTKLYDAVKKECPPQKCEGKNFKSIVRKTYEELLSGFKVYKVSKV